MPGVKAWQAANVERDDWLLTVSDDVTDEVSAVAEQLQHQERPFLKCSPDDFAVDATRKLMDEAGRRLTQGLGFVVVDRFPVESLPPAAKSGLAWLLGNMLGRVVAQKWGGTFLYDVRDSGKALQHGVRRSITNLEQDFHTDGPWLHWTPETIGLFCLQPASEGGESRVASLLNAVESLATQPELLSRLQQPVYWDRQAEHEPDDRAFSEEPVFFEDQNGPAVRWYPDYVENGYKLAGQTLASETKEALARVQSALRRPENFVEFKLAAGQLLYLDNRRVTHSRQAFRDDHANRHYIRIWNRNEGTLHLEGRLPLDLDQVMTAGHS